MAGRYHLSDLDRLCLTCHLPDCEPARYDAPCKQPARRNGNGATMSTTEAARALGVCHTTIIKRIHAGTLEARYEAGRWRVDAGAVGR